MKKIFVLPAIAALFSCFYLQASEAEHYDVKSYETLEVAVFNNDLIERSSHQSVVALALEFLSYPDARFMSIKKQDNSGENPTEASVTIILDGLMDDSVRGLFYQLDFTKHHQQWRLDEAKQAYLCGRMNSPKEFSKELCP
ncbi:hypothetical protein L4D20_02505 [Vibrio kyushuensis]|uniref:hypothetical protein n=1 Tax=Vibrio kyushuensis TaxID=2910249 RepID=UPI003D0DB028